MAEIGEMVEAGVRVFSDDGTASRTRACCGNALTYARTFEGVVIAEHCEDPTLAEGGQMHEGYHSYSLGLAGRPREAEEIVVARDLAMARLTGGRLHLQHLSSAGSVEMVRRAKADGLRVTAEVTPHHLVFTDEDLVTYDTNFKVNPPLRTPEDRDALRAALADGTIDAVATDHAPHAVEEKEVEFDQAPPGTIGLETALAAVLTHLVEPGTMLALARAIEAMSTAPAADPRRRRPRRTDRARPPGEPGRVRPRGRVGGRAAVRLEEPQLGVPRATAPRAGWSTRSTAGSSSSPTGRPSGDRAPAAVLVLEDGTVFRGRAFGATGEAFGEAVFNTGDVRLPGGAHRPLVRRAGGDDDGARTRATTARTPRTRSPAACRWRGSWSARPRAGASSWRAAGTLADELARAGRRRASRGSTPAGSRSGSASAARCGAGCRPRTWTPRRSLERVRATRGMEGADLAGGVSTAEPYEAARARRAGDAGTTAGCYRVAAYDFGMKREHPAAARGERDRGDRGPGRARRPSEVRRVRRRVPVERAGRPGRDGLRHRGGPRPARDACPLFGICLGHQLLGLALGGRTYKMKFGHRGANQPVKDLRTGRVEVTSHNHGFAVDPDGWPREGNLARDRVRPRRAHPLEPERRHARGAAVPRRAGALGAVPPGGGARAARRRATCSTEFRALMEAA